MPCDPTQRRRTGIHKPADFAVNDHRRRADQCRQRPDVIAPIPLRLQSCAGQRRARTGAVRVDPHRRDDRHRAEHGRARSQLHDAGYERRPAARRSAPLQARRARRSRPATTAPANRAARRAISISPASTPPAPRRSCRKDRSRRTSPPRTSPIRRDGLDFRYSFNVLATPTATATATPTTASSLEGATPSAPAGAGVAGSAATAATSGAGPRLRQRAARDRRTRSRPHRRPPLCRAGRHERPGSSAVHTAYLPSPDGRAASRPRAASNAAREDKPRGYAVLLILLLWVLAAPARASEESQALSARGLIELNAGQTQEALELFDKAVAADPSDARRALSTRRHARQAGRQRRRHRGHARRARGTAGFPPAALELGVALAEIWRVRRSRALAAAGAALSRSRRAGLVLARRRPAASRSARRCSSRTSPAPATRDPSLAVRHRVLRRRHRVSAQ